MPKSNRAVECDMPEAHEAHMDLNGECPWCGAFDPSLAV